jgi:hypothetical protein
VETANTAHPVGVASVGEMTVISFQFLPEMDLMIASCSEAILKAESLAVWM